MELLRSLEVRARGRLDPAVYDYFAGGAGDERTIAENAEAWDHVWLRPHQLAGAGGTDASIELLGTRLAAPLLLAPVAAQRLVHPEGEIASARAAAAAGTLLCLSTRATADTAEIAAAIGDAPRWFQLYVLEDRSRPAAVLASLRGHGFDHVVLTIDLPVPGRRERELRHGLVPLPPGVRIVTHLGGAEPEHEAAGKPHIGGWDAALDWADIGWVHETSGGLGVIVKGVLTARDARLAVEHGACAVIVSNHGGRQLDGVVPTAVALREVAAEVGGEVPVLVDGGVRSGADVVRALALGADAVLVGRPYVWGLAAGGPEGEGGETGVRAVLDALIADTIRALALVGARTPSDVTGDHVRLRGW